VGLMGAVLGTNALRRSGALNFLSKAGVKVPTNADGTVDTKAVANELLEEAEAKSPALAAVGSFFNSVKAQSVRFKNAVNSLPLPDSVKSIVNDPTKLLPKATQDKLHAMEEAVGIQTNGEAPDAPRAVEDTPDAPVALKVAPSTRRMVSAPPTPVSTLDLGVVVSRVQKSLPSVQETDDVSLENEFIDNTPQHDNCPSCVAKAKAKAKSPTLPSAPTTSPVASTAPTTSPTAPPGVSQPSKKQPEPTASFTPEDLKKHMDMLKQYMSTQMPTPQPQPQPQKAKSPPPPPQAKSPITTPKAQPQAQAQPQPKPQPKAKIEVNAAELAEIKALLASKNKQHKVLG